MLDFDISLEKGKILATGSVFTFRKEPITIVLDPEDKHDSYISLTFEFKDDNRQSAPSMSFESTGEHSGRLLLKNMNSSIGNGVFDPEPIASNKDSTLYLSFRVSKPKTQESHLIEFTFFSRVDESNDNPSKNKKARNGRKKTN